MKIKRILQKDEDFKSFLKQKIKSFNNVVSPYHLASRKEGYINEFSIRVESDEFIGGLTGQIYWNMMEILDFFVEEAYRKSGLGSKVIREAIDYAKELDLSYVLLKTFSFQAKTFYEKFGFKVIGEIKDYPPGESLYTLRLDL